MGCHVFEHKMYCIDGLREHLGLVKYANTGGQTNVHNLKETIRFKKINIFCIILTTKLLSHESTITMQIVIFFCIRNLTELLTVYAYDI